MIGISLHYSAIAKYSVRSFFIALILWNKRMFAMIQMTKCETDKDGTQCLKKVKVKTKSKHHFSKELVYMLNFVRNWRSRSGRSKINNGKCFKMPKMKLLHGYWTQKVKVKTSYLKNYVLDSARCWRNQKRRSNRTISDAQSN